MNNLQKEQIAKGQMKYVIKITKLAKQNLKDNIVNLIDKMIEEDTKYYNEEFINGEDLKKEIKKI